MRRTLRDLRENLEEFVRQPDYALLLVGSTDAEVPYLLKTQEQLQGEDPRSVYFSFADDFLEEHSYALGIAQRFVDQLTIENARRTSDGEPLLEAFPPALLAPATAPEHRLLIAAQHIHGWLGDPEEDRVVMALTPMRVAPGDGYLRFIGQYAQFGSRHPWMNYLRIVARDDRANHTTARALGHARANGALTIDVDFSTEALAADLAAEAVDPSVPLADRMQAHLQLAMIDMSYRRYSDAITKYAVLFDYYERTEAPLMQALCLLGVGDCMRMNGDLVNARGRYQQGLAMAMAAPSPVPVQAPIMADGSPNPNPAMHPSAPPIVLNLLLAAGETSMSLSLFEDAASYFDSASRIAARCLNPQAAADSLERKGDAELALARHGDAVKTWQDAATIAENGRYVVRQESVLLRMRQVYVEARMPLEVQQLDDKLAVVRAQNHHQHGAHA